MIWQQFTSWISENKAGDVASILGVIISVFGFFVTIIGVFKSRSAAKRAEDAAKATRDSIRLFDTVVDFSTAVSILEDIKRLHRSNEWSLLPDRYSAIRKILISLRSGGHVLTDSQSVAIQSALTNLRDIENQVEKSIANSSAPKPAKYNSVISGDLDRLLVVLNELKLGSSGG